MSLNGLDASAVTEAHKSALAEAGGWFLLKYTTRDTVELLSKASNGVLEARAAIEQYEEKSPLFGLVQYRRKKIILKFVPEGTSRLLQVRLTVQFQSVLDTFQPYDAIFSFTDANELTEAALSSACMLHSSVAPGSLTSSSSSLRKQRLGEISEDVEEGGNMTNTASADATTPTKLRDFPADMGKSGLEILSTSANLSVPTSATPPRSHPATTEESSIKAIEERRTIPEKIASQSQTQSTLPPPISKIEKSLPHTLEANKELANSRILPEQARPISRAKEESRPVSRATEKARPLSRARDESIHDEPRASLHSGRPVVSEADKIAQIDAYLSSFPAFKPKKKKLGPRPHVEPQNRPQTSAASNKNSAGLPSSVRTSIRPAFTQSDRPDSRQSSKSVPSRFVHYAEPAALPPLPTGNHISSLYSPPRDQRTVSRPPSIAPSVQSATPEKLRLMKALQMRKRNQMLARGTSADAVQSVKPSNETEAATSVRNGEESTDPTAIPTQQVQTERVDTPSNQDSSRDSADNMTSPLSATERSGGVSTQASSFSDEPKKRHSRGSISTDTDSSVTPRATGEEAAMEQSVKQSSSSEIAEKPVSKAPISENAQKPTKMQAVHNLATGQPVSPLPTSEALRNETPKPEDIPLPPSTSVKQITSEKGIFDTTIKGHDRKASATNTIEQPGSERSRRKRRTPDPLKIAPNLDLGDASDEDEESFMDELEHAQLEEAKPISVARSPITPVYSRTMSDRPRDPIRTLSSPMMTPVDSSIYTPDKPRTPSGRSFSGALPNMSSQEAETPPLPLAKKGTLSSGISKRIKALEVFTHRESSSSPAQLQSGWPPKAKPNVASFRKRAPLTPFVQASATAPSPGIALPSVAPSEIVEPSKIPGSKPGVQRHGSATEVLPQQKGETISVTARIIRDPPSTLPETHPNPSEPAPLHMHRSPLTVEHHGKNEPDQSRPALTSDVSSQFMESVTKSPKSERSRFSFTSSRSPSQVKVANSDSLTGRLSLMGGNKKTGSSNARSSSEVSSIAEDKSKESRASRLMKRMSNFTGGHRKNPAGSLSPAKERETPGTIEERDESPGRKSSVISTLAHVVDVGDLNVQFPDTLLWKRRFLRIDDQGYLIFTPPTMERNPRGISRKFHLADFEKPRLPDIEREEMAWSILLESKEGSCIQCACDSKYTQGQVLRTLVDAHSAYHQLYGTE